jgi:FkbM family methyltransferase
MTDQSIEAKTFSTPSGSTYVLYFRKDYDQFHTNVSRTGGRTPSGTLCFDICKSNGTFFDIGANIGTVCIPIVTKGTSVYAFELLRENVALLEKAAEANQFRNFHPVLAAVSDGDGLMYGGGRSAWGRALDTGSSGDEVPSFTLDRFIVEHKIENVDVVKIDVEGHENRVLAGARDVLGRFRPIVVIESNILTCGISGYSYGAMLSVLEDYGYRFYRIHNGFLEPVDSEYWQEVICCDYVCLADSANGVPAHWPIRKRDRSEIVSSILQQERETQAHQGYVVIASEQAPNEIVQDVRVNDKLAEWREHLVNDKELERILRIGAGQSLADD